MNSTDSALGPGDQTRVRRFDRVCDEFEAAWRAGNTPQLEDYLSQVAGDLREDAFVELLSLDLEYRADRGLPSAAHDYERRFPDFRTAIGAAFELLGSTRIRLETVGSRRRPVLSVPDRLGDYELLGEIGRGGMGVVFKARQVSLDRIVALKIIRGDGLLAEESVRRFQTEARSAAGLRHPGIVQVHDVGADGPYRFYSMEYVEGQTLSEVRAQGGVSSQQAARWLAELAAAVDFAHEQGILHRDLKPSNVLVDRDGRLRIADFGLAKQITGAETLTSLGQVLGTPAYMSPEQARGEHGLIDRRSDVYSLGGMLYVLLTGRPPFQGRTPIDTLVEVIHDPPCAPHERNPQVDRTLEAICLKCLAKDPELRYPTAQALRFDLDRFLSGQTGFLEGAPGKIRSFFKFRRHSPVRNRRAGRRRLAASLVAVFSVATVIYYNRPNVPRSSSTAALPQSQDGSQVARENASPTNDGRASASVTKTRRPEPRLLHPGALDPGFGDDGQVRIEFGRGGGLQDAYAVALQPDGKIVVAGQVERSRAKNNNYMALARLLPDGTPDTSFNTTGRSIFWFGIFDDGLSGRSLLIQPDGKIVVGGRAEVSTVGYDFGLARFNPDGSEDSTFGGRGLVTTNVTGARSSYLHVLALDLQGRIIACGAVATPEKQNALALVRYLPDGLVDPKFGSDGRVLIDFPDYDERVCDILVQPDEKIVVSGSAGAPHGNDFVVTRHDTDGKPDGSFGEHGRAVLAFDESSSQAGMLALQDQKLVVQVIAEPRNFLVRLNADGSRDLSFGRTGHGRAGEGRAGADFSVAGFEITPAGTIVAVEPIGQRLAVFSADGVLEKSYGPPAAAATPPVQTLPHYRDLVRSADGKLIFCGTIASDERNSQWIVSRLLGPP